MVHENQPSRHHRVRITNHYEQSLFQEGEASSASSYQKKKKEKIFAVAPMLDKTDRHCRYFYRQLSSRALLYTEMIHADAVLYCSDRDKLLGYHEDEHPVALQLGGCDPERLAQAAKIAIEEYGYDEVNLNIGCPSSKVTTRKFGACLMLEPGLVARCVRAIKNAVGVPVTVKCRLGVDDQDCESTLDGFVAAIFDAGCDALWVHARKAWLEGLSTLDNRTVPPLDYERVYRLKEKYPTKFIGLNGGIQTLQQAWDVTRFVDGVMVGRAVYKNAAMLTNVDRVLYDRVTPSGCGDGRGSSEQGGETEDDDWATKQAVIEIPNRPPVDYDWVKLCTSMTRYCERYLSTAKCHRIIHVARHMSGLFHGYKGARKYRQTLTSGIAFRKETGAELIELAFRHVLKELEDGHKEDSTNDATGGTVRQQQDGEEQVCSCAE